MMEGRTICCRPTVQAVGKVSESSETVMLMLKAMYHVIDLHFFSHGFAGQVLKFVEVIGIVASWR